MLYIITTVDESVFKLGYSDDPWKRLCELQTGNAQTLKLFATFHPRCSDSSAEAQYHRMLRGSRVRGEWFQNRQMMYEIARRWHL